MTSSSPLVSVIIPTYNRAAILGRAIESALKQTYPNVEIIVVDDGSTDDTATLVGQYKNVLYVLQEHAGQGRARNNGLKKARGTYIASLDSDDEWEPVFLERSVQSLEANEKLGFVFANWLQIVNEKQGFDFLTVTSKILKDLAPKNTGGWVPMDYEETRRLFIEGCPSPSSSILIRREYLARPWDEQMKIADDWCLLLDIVLINKCPAAFIPDRLWYKRADGKNIFQDIAHFDMVENLLVHDLGLLIERHKMRLTPDEFEYMYHKHIRSTYQLCINRIFRKKDIKKYTKLLKRTLANEPGLFFPEVSLMIREKISRSIKKIYKKEISSKLELISIDAVPTMNITNN